MGISPLFGTDLYLQDHNLPASDVIPDGQQAFGDGVEPTEARFQESTDDISYGGFYFAGYNLGDISSRNGIPVFSKQTRLWIQRHVGVEAFTAFNTMIEHDRATPACHQTINSAGWDALPPRRIIEAYISIYKASPLRLVFPIIQETLFQRTVSLAYEDTPSFLGRDVVNAKTCILAFTAALSVLEPEQTAVLSNNASLCADRAEQSILSVLAAPTIDGLQASIMLLLYRDFCGQLQTATLLHSISWRCVSLFRAHVRPATGVGTDTVRGQCIIEHLRGLFWLCYFFDKHISLRTGQPPVIEDSLCDLTIPREYAGCVSIHQAAMEPRSWQSSPDLFPCDLELTKLKSKVFTVLYSHSALTKPDAQLLRDIRELDAELETWRISVPSNIRPCLSKVTGVVESNVPQSLGMYVVFVHFEYLFLLATIHRACGRCQAWRDNGVDAQETALHSSLALSVQGSRSTLRLLKVAFWDIHRESFWLIIFYPMWATITIFCNLLYNPGLEANSDLELLKLLPSLIKGMHIRQVSAIERMQLDLLDSFFGEIVRLAECAIRHGHNSVDMIA
ncbi:hypothetical protein FP744_10000120 [Trichoderma asperellum]